VVADAVRARLYRPARNTYQRLFNREHWQQRARLRDLLRQFVPKGALTFDVGAHNGQFAETLRELGGRVVAVEPNPSLAAEIQAHFTGIVVEQAAVGSQPGRATLRLGRYDEHSTLSQEWAEAKPERWSGEVEVAVTTLDDLIARHGEPQFVKIDVEGFEAEVVAGLSTPVPALSLEYQHAAPHLSETAAEGIARLGDYRFALSAAGSYELSEWTGLDECMAELRRRAEADPTGYGDVYARRA